MTETEKKVKKANAPKAEKKAKNKLKGPKLPGSKRFRAATEKKPQTPLRILDAIAKLRETSTCKFKESVDIAVNLDVDVKQADQQIRKMLSLPNGTGKTIRVACLVPDDKAAAEAKAAGADLVGSDDLIEDIAKGVINFDRLIATPNVMAKLGKVAKILGPKGLMPNPKLGTVTTDVATAVKNAKAGQIELKTDKQGTIHATIGKISFTDEQLAQNFAAVIGEITESKPKAVKGKYFKSVYLAPTMGPSVQIDLTVAA
jgi:large subunit ribosomal protein L1